MNKIAIASLIVPAALIFSGSTNAGTISTFSDWGIDSSDFSTSNTSVYSNVEDQHDSFLDPGYGGQNYDAEAIYTTWDSDNLYITVITGRKQNVSSGWAAGDIAFDLGNDNSFEYGLVTSSSTGSKAAAAGIGLAGELFAVDAWNYGIWDSSGNHVGFGHANADKDHVTSVKSGTKIGDASDFNYSGGFNNYGNWASDTHYAISATLDLDLFGGAANLFENGFSLHWTAVCNNDWIALEIGPQTIPEPTTVALLALGLLSIAASRRGRRQS